MQFGDPNFGESKGRHTKQRKSLGNVRSNAVNRAPSIQNALEFSAGAVLMAEIS
jgi:hypothetical protein